MNRLYLVVCFINIFVFSVHSAPTTVSNIFDLIQNYSVKNCTVLNKNVLVDKDMSYLARCRDVVLNKVPADVGFDSMNAYLCVGVLDAEFRLCNAIANESYTMLPKSFEDLRESIENIRNNSAKVVCDKLNNFSSTYNYSSDTRVAPWMSKFNAQLFGTDCSFLCSDIGHRTNVFCSLLYYVNVHIQNVQNTIQQRKLKLIPEIHSVGSTVVKSTTTANDKSDNVAVVVPNAQHNKTKVEKIIPPAPQVQAGKVKQITNTTINVTAAATTTTTTVESNLTTTTAQLHDPVVGDKNSDTQPAKTEHVQESQNGVVQSPVESVAPVANVKETPIIVQETVADQLPKANAQNSAPETVAVENKLDTPQTNEEPDVTNRNTAIETADNNVDMEIFNTPGPAGLKDLKQDDSYDDDDDTNFKLEDDAPGPDKEQESAVPVISDQSISPREYADVEDSNFFAYFMFVSVMFIAGYVVYHNKQKILALVLEGRRDRNSRRRPNTASYRKLNSNLEEAVTSKCSGSAAHVIY